MFRNLKLGVYGAHTDFLKNAPSHTPHPNPRGDVIRSPFPFDS